MPRGVPSQADTALIAALRARGVHVSEAQLERWRKAGLLPRNQRHGLGRGSGSTSHVPPGAVDLAEGLALASLRGRPLHEAVLRLFTYNPRFHINIFLVTPPLPLAERPVRDALTWFIQYRENSVTRRIERAIARAHSSDAAEEIAADLAQRHYLGVLRAQRKDFAESIVTRGIKLTRDRAIGLSNLAISGILGQDAIGADLLADAIRDSTVIPDNSRAELESLIQFMIRENQRRGFAGEPLIGAHPPETMERDIAALRAIDFTALCRMRDTLALLAEGDRVAAACADLPVLRGGHGRRRAGRGASG
jgi:hypothetical protein